jgi:hypothetical protein
MSTPAIIVFPAKKVGTKDLSGSWAISVCTYDGDEAADALNRIVKTNSDLGILAAKGDFLEPFADTVAELDFAMDRYDFKEKSSWLPIYFTTKKDFEGFPNLSDLAQSINKNRLSADYLVVYNKKEKKFLSARLSDFSECDAQGRNWDNLFDISISSSSKAKDNFFESVYKEAHKKRI